MTELALTTARAAIADLDRLEAAERELAQTSPGARRVERENAEWVIRAMATAEDFNTVCRAGASRDR